MKTCHSCQYQHNHANQRVCQRCKTLLHASAIKQIQRCAKHRLGDLSHFEKISLGLIDPAWDDAFHSIPQGPSLAPVQEEREHIPLPLQNSQEVQTEWEQHVSTQVTVVTPSSVSSRPESDTSLDGIYG